MLDPFQRGNEKTRGKAAGGYERRTKQRGVRNPLRNINLLKTKPSITRLVAALNSFGQRQRK